MKAVAKRCRRCNAPIYEALLGFGIYRTLCNACEVDLSRYSYQIGGR